MTLRSKYLFLIVAVAFFACKKKTTDSPAKPQISIISPASNAVYNFGDTVRIKANITHTSDLHEVSAVLKPSAKDSTILEYEKHVDAPSFTIDTFYVNKAASTTAMTVTFMADDHNNNSSSSAVNITCKGK
jgi:hypothetical protein